MKKIIIFSNSDAHFYHHLLPLALKAKIEGYKVKILTNVENFREKIENHGLDVIHIKIKRGNANPINELILLYKIIRVIYHQRPDILHNFTIKPIFYGSFAGFLCRTPKIINNFLGMGALFIGNKLIYRILRSIICRCLKIISKFQNIIYITQNADDKQLLLNLNITKPELIFNQCSVGIDTQNFPILPKVNNHKFIFTLVARMLVDKGIYEFIEAAEILSKKGLNAEFWLVGDPDPQNPSSIHEDVLRKYHKAGFIKYLGYQKDIKLIWEQSHVAVLPSYREGLSRSLLEAGAYGRAVITTDAPGGRALIKDKVNGLLVPIKNSQNLADAMELLIKDQTLGTKLAKKLRQDIIQYYDNEIITNEMLKFYK